MLKNITLSAEVFLLEKARDKARKHKTTLNSVFREWLKNYVLQNTLEQDYQRLMKKLDYVVVGKKFSREDMNER